MSITMTTAQLPSGTVTAQHIVLAAQLSAANAPAECSCKNDGILAFALPWLAVTTLGTVATFNQPDSAFLVQAVIPGLLAGASGLLMYKLVKKSVKQLRRHISQSA